MYSVTYIIVVYLYSPFQYFVYKYNGIHHKLLSSLLTHWSFIHFNKYIWVSIYITSTVCLTNTMSCKYNHEQNPDFNPDLSEAWSL